MQEPPASPDIVSNGHGTTESPGKTIRLSNMSSGSDSELSSELRSSENTSYRRSENVTEEPGGNQPDAIAQSPAASIAERPSSYRFTVIELVSISASSSAFPENFGLSVSTRGRWVVAYSSAALYILPVQRLAGLQDCYRAFRLRRKPLAVVINDVGNFAILNNTYKVDVYKCGDGSINSLSTANVKVQTIQLNSEARAIAISAKGELIAAGSDTGVEIVGLGLPEGSDRRQIQSGPVESMSFSDDQKSLLVTGPARRTRNSTLLSVSISFQQAMMMDESEADEQLPVGKLWISQLIFPEQLQARQSVFLPDPSNGQSCELLAYDKQVDRFGIFDTVLKQFTGKTLAIPEDVTWTNASRYEETLLGVSSSGSRIAMVVCLNNEMEIWTYQTTAEWRDEDGLQQYNLPVARTSIRSQICGPSESINRLRWIEDATSETKQLLVLMSTAARSMPEDMEATSSSAASGKMIICNLEDLNYEQAAAQSKVLIDLDEYSLTETLAEEQVEMEREIDLLRRRTQVQRTHQSQSNRHQRPQETPATPPPRLRRALSSSSGNSHTGALQVADLYSSRVRRRRSFSSISDMGEDNESSSGAAVDEPYSQLAPRPLFMLNRAATVAQNSVTSRTHSRAETSRPLEYRRADGLREIPHESDADNWVPPPPPYSARPDVPGPNALSLPIQTIPGLAERVLQGSHFQQNHGPSPHGMRSRVSQVISGFQVPAMIPPRSQAQPRYADPTRLPGPPVNVSIGAGSVRRPPSSAFPVSSQLPRNDPSTTSASSTTPVASVGRTSARELNAGRRSPQPIPSVIHSTAPSSDSQQLHNIARLVIPRTTSSGSFSAPVTPMSQVIAQQSALPSSAGPMTHTNECTSQSQEDNPLLRSPPSHSPLQPGVSAELDILPSPTSGAQRKLTHRSSDLTDNLPTRRPQIVPYPPNHEQHYSHHSSSDIPSRRQYWWRSGGANADRPTASSTIVASVARQSTTRSEQLEKKEKCRVM